ncbi:hypothetical protein [Priestia aryabhattai]|uniref:hypothetical protein n=1 Tax=Priestia aryabhattai TaxID=412384 RepID=UPI003CA89766
MSYVIVGCLKGKTGLIKNQSQEKCIGYVSVLKTTCSDFKDVNKEIRVEAYDKQAAQLNEIRVIGKSTYVLLTFDKDSYRDAYDKNKQLIKAIKPILVTKATARDIERYNYNKDGQYDPFSRYIEG